MLHHFLSPLKQATAGLSEPPGPALATASLYPQLGFAWESPSPVQVAAICFIALQGAPGKTQVGADIGLHDLGNPRASIPSGQLQTTSEHRHPAPGQPILNGGWRLVVSGHSQSLQLTGLDKSFPLICQEQPRLNYKRVYSTHMKGTPQIPSLGDRGGCTTGPFRTPTTLGHTTKTRSHSSSI